MSIAPPGTVITSDPSTIRFFETVAELESVKQSDATPVEGDFTQQVADNVSTRAIRLEGQNEVLVLNDLDEGGLPGPQPQLHCPQ